MNYFLFLDSDEVYYNGEKVDIENFDITKIKKEFGIIIADWHVFNVNFKLNIKKAADAKKAAENHFLYLNHNPNFNPLYYQIRLKKVEDGFRADVFYLSEEAEELIEKLKELKLYEKCKFIVPLFEVLKEKKIYKVLDYITFFKDDLPIIIHSKDFENFKNIIEEMDSDIYNVDLNELKNLKIEKVESDLNFVKKNKSLEFVEKVFFPVLIFLFLLNLCFFTYTKYLEIKYGKKLKEIKKINIQLRKRIDPVIKAESTLKKLRELNASIEKYTKSQFPYLKFFKFLSDNVKFLYIRNFRTYGNIIRFSGKTDSVINLVEKLKKFPYIRDPKVVSNITRDSKGFESFRIEARIKYE